jgi:hypothetical protein
MKTMILRLYASQRTHLSDRDANQFRFATVQQGGGTCGTMPSLTKLEFLSQMPLSEAQSDRTPSLFAHKFMKQERLAWAVRA